MDWWTNKRLIGSSVCPYSFFAQQLTPSSYVSGFWIRDICQFIGCRTSERKVEWNDRRRKKDRSKTKNMQEPCRTHRCKKRFLCFFIIFIKTRFLTFFTF